MKEKVEDMKEVIRIRKLKKNTQYNGQKKKDKSTNKDLQHITHKTKDRVTRNIVISAAWLSIQIKSMALTCMIESKVFQRSDKFKFT